MSLTLPGKPAALGTAAAWKSILRFLPGLLVGLLGTAILFKDLILAGRADLLWADDFDPRLMYWIANWGYHILIEEAQPLQFWNANSFYPHDLTLAYSDSLISAQLFFAPLRLLGFSPLVALYGSLAAICVLGAVLTNAALVRIGGFSVEERLFITYAAHFSLGMTAYFVHYQLFGFQLAPPFLLFLFLYLRDLRARDLAVTLAIFGLGVGLAVYLAPMLLALSLLLAIPFIIHHVRQRGIGLTILKVGLAGFGTFILFTLLLYFIQFKPYMLVNASFPPQDYEDSATYSADYASIFSNRSRFSEWYGRDHNYSDYGEWEYAYFPGAILLMLSGLFLVIWGAGRVRARMGFHVKGIQSANASISARFLLFMLILLVASIVLSWGPYDKSDDSVKLPFYYLSEIVFGLRSVRAPGRFGMLVGLPLAVFAVAGLRSLVPKEKKSNLVISGFLILLVIESLQTFPTFPFSPDLSGIYKEVARQIQPGTPLMELPVQGQSYLDTVRIHLEQLNGSTLHWGQVMVGYGARSTRESARLVNLDRRIQGGRLEPQAAFEYGLEHGMHYFLIHIDRYDPPLREKWKDAALQSGQILIEDENILFVRIPGRLNE